MSYCGPQGIPRSRFLRWPQRDQDDAMAWALHERTRCPSCGTRPEDWDPEQGGRDDAYRAELHKCWGCDAKASAEKKIREDMGPGVFVTLVRVEGPREDPGEGVEPPAVRDPGQEVPGGS